MEHGNFFETPCPKEYSKYVGYNTVNQYTQILFQPSTVNSISARVTKALADTRVEPNGRPIIVPNATICNVLSGVYDSYVPETGDIMTRYNVMPVKPDDYVKSIVEQTIEIIVADVTNNMEMVAHNNTLTVWTTVLGSFNPHGLQAHGPLKINHRHPNMMEFNMNY
jgi:hypothetical protein